MQGSVQGQYVCTKSTTHSIRMVHMSAYRYATHTLCQGRQTNRTCTAGIGTTSSKSFNRLGRRKRPKYVRCLVPLEGDVLGDVCSGRPLQTLQSSPSVPWKTMKFRPLMPGDDNMPRRLYCLIMPLSVRCHRRGIPEHQQCLVEYFSMKAV